MNKYHDPMRSVIRWNGEGDLTTHPQ